MKSKVLFLCLFTFLTSLNIAKADEPVIIEQPNRGLMINKYVQFANNLGASESRCAGLNEAIKSGWTAARDIMVQDLSNAGVNPVEASFILDRAYITSRSAPPEMQVITDCDKTLNMMYQFKKEHTQ